MQMYEVSALAEDNKTQVLYKIVFAESEDDAINILEEELDACKLQYSICMAEEIS